MADCFSKEHRSLVMSHIHSSDTRPEIFLRKGLWHLGFRYITNDKRLPGKPDIVLPRYKTVIFVHGCFWHAHLGCGTFKMPHSNTAYWEKKISSNISRDQEVWRKLEAKGWAVIIVWECELKKNQFEETICRVEKEILTNGEAYRRQKEDRRHQREQRRTELREQKRRHSALMAEIKESHKG